jgi:spoIIIJ-associated protein
MGEDRVFEGRDLEEALGTAAETLGIPQEEVHYEMLDAGRRGLLGLGVKNVRIRVKPPIEAELQPDEPPRKAKRSRPGRRPRGGKKAATAKRPREPKRSQGPKNPQGTRNSQGPRNSQAPKKPVEPVDEAVVQEVEKTVLQFVEQMGLELEVSAKPRDDGVQLRLEGPDEKMLVTRNAELLSAIQFLLNRMSRRAWPGVGRISLTCNGHAKPRDDELVATVRKVAKQVARSGKTRKLQPMNAYERRLVHLTVQEFSGLTSSSDGNGAMKRVRISKVQNQI